MHERLASFPHFRADDLKAVQAWARKRLRAQRRKAVRETGLDYRVNLVRWTHTTLAWVGADVAGEVTIPAYTAGYLVQIPDAGEQEFIVGKERVIATPSRAAIVSPSRPGPIVHRSGPGGRLVLQLDNALVRAIVRECGGAEPPEQLPELPLSMDLTSGHGRIFRTLLLNLVEELDRPGSVLLATECVLNNVTKSLAALLVVPVASSLKRKASPVDGVVAHIVRHLEQPMTVEDLARVGRMNKRSLQRAFQARFEMSPLEFVRRRRLEQAYTLLSSASPGMTVTAAALRVGFGHMGRFARDYHAQYGEKPSETLARLRPPAGAHDAPRETR